jgi:hypothetical protein
MALSRRNLIYLAVADVVLFVIANALYSGGHVSRDISNVLDFGTFEAVS